MSSQQGRRDFNGLREARADRQAYDAKARQRLKAISLELTSLSSAATRLRDRGSHHD
jgi:hypothetical protein